MNKLSIRHFKSLKKISKRDSINEQDIIKEMKSRVKKDPAVVEKFKEYNVPVDEIDDVHVEFKDLDVSAKTKNGKIYLNKKMLDADSEVKDPTHYLAHELIHYLQQTTGNVAGHKVEEYLDKPTEIEAFKVQIDFKERNESPEAADIYVEELLDHHEIDDDEERKQKAKELKDD